MIWHEQWCSSNPNNITPCFNCVHLGKDGESLKLENGEMVFKIIGGYYCNKLDKQLHSFKAICQLETQQCFEHRKILHTNIASAPVIMDFPDTLIQSTIIS